MGKEILVETGRSQTRVAVLEDQVVVELYIERQRANSLVGNIYKGRVENVLPGMQAAFINIGLPKNAFLFAADVETTGRKEEKAGNSTDTPSITGVVRKGQELIVQVMKEAFGEKGPRVTAKISLPGRFWVLLPGCEHLGVSRRIEEEEERERLRKLGEKIRPSGMGLIARTVAAGIPGDELARDLTELSVKWETIIRKAENVSAPFLLHKEAGLIDRLTRDLFSPAVDRFVIDSLQVYRGVLETVKAIAPEIASRVELYRGDTPLFAAFGIEAELKKALRRRVLLKSGGTIVIDQTEALVAVDVNTGKFVGKTNLAETVLKTNLEAAREIARQLRLRDLGGIIIIDFIDMQSKEDRERVLTVLQEELSKDRTPTHVVGLTGLGLIEITRKKVRQSLSALLEDPCPYCSGTGKVASAEMVADRAEETIIDTLQGSTAEAVCIVLHPRVAAIFREDGGERLARLADELGKHIFIWENPLCRQEDVRIMAMGSREEVARKMENLGGLL